MNTIHLRGVEANSQKNERLRKAYSRLFNPMTSKHQWPRVELGYKIRKPKLRRKPRRPRGSRIKATEESGTRKKKRCNKYGAFGHVPKYCQGGPTAKEKRKRLSASQKALGESSNDPSISHPSSASGTASAISSGREVEGEGEGEGGGVAEEEDS